MSAVQLNCVKKMDVKGYVRPREGIGNPGKGSVRCRLLLGVIPLTLSLIMVGCGGGVSAAGSTTAPSAPAVTPAVTITASPSGSISNAQVLSVAIAVSSSSGTPAGTVVVGSGNFASFPATASNGAAQISVPAALLPLGADTLTANFTPSNPSIYNSGSGTANVTIVASAAPVVTASSVSYSTGGYGSPFRALLLASGNVLVSVTAVTSGILVYGPDSSGGLQLSCFNYVRPEFVQNGASDLGMNLTPNGHGLAATLGVDGAIFYNLSVATRRAPCWAGGIAGQVSPGCNCHRERWQYAFS